VAVDTARQVNVVVLETAAHSLDEHIVHLAPAAIHRDADADALKCADQGEAGELAALALVGHAIPVLRGTSITFLHGLSSPNPGAAAVFVDELYSSGF
jgi:hypothetical protein